jgi:hypothetical protein
MDRVDHAGELAPSIAGRRPTLKAPEVFSVRVGFRDLVGDDDDVVLIVRGVLVDSFEQVHKDNRVRLVWIRVTPIEPFDIHAPNDDADIVLRDFGEGVLVDADACAGHGRECGPIILAMEQSVTVQFAKRIDAWKLPSRSPHDFVKGVRQGQSLGIWANNSSDPVPSLVVRFIKVRQQHCSTVDL